MTIGCLKEQKKPQTSLLILLSPSRHGAIIKVVSVISVGHRRRGRSSQQEEATRAHGSSSGHGSLGGALGRRAACSMRPLITSSPTPALRPRALRLPRAHPGIRAPEGTPRLETPEFLRPLPLAVETACDVGGLLVTLPGLSSRPCGRDGQDTPHPGCAGRDSPSTAARGRAPSQESHLDLH